MVSWFFAVLLSWFHSFLVSWFQSFLVSKFLGFLVSKFLGFLVSEFLGLKVSWCQSFKDLPNFHLMFCFFLEDIDPIFEILKISLDVQRQFLKDMYFSRRAQRK